MENLQAIYDTTNNGTFGKLTGIAISLPDRSIFVSDVDSFMLRKLRYNGLDITDNIHTFLIEGYPYPWTWGAINGLAIHNGILYIVDKIHHIVVAMGVHDLIVRGYYGVIDDPGATNNKFYSPTGICTDGRYIYIADSGNQRIMKLTTGLKFVAESSGDIELNTCYHVAYDPGQHVLFIPHHSEGNIIKCTIDFATILATYGNGLGSDDGYFLGLENVCVDDKYLYVADSSNYRIQVFSKTTGAWKAKLGAVGQSDFYYPHTLFYHDKKIFVAEYYGRRIKVITNYDGDRGSGSGFIEDEPLNTEVRWRIEQ